MRAADVEELSKGEPTEVAAENARRKARAVARTAPGAVVIGADTIVALEGRIFGKPTDEARARATLEALGGRRHEVITGLCIVEGGRLSEAVARTTVEFRELRADLIDWYLTSGEWRDRAGGYAVQERGSALVRRIEGDYLNVVGLPVAALLDLRPGLLPGRTIE